ncbi:MAG TPA: formate-dependent phosphoribosylglycinamide formyltransferase [Rhodanobacter sp.]|nr:formate-dependent phosphoribosylglycinamide formyltransferase [Rhodanobacter sp.]
MKSFGTPYSDHSLRVLLLGAGELGKEVAIELQRYAVEVIAVDRYANAPAMQVAHRSHVIDMLDGAALRAVIEQEQPDLVVPEIEAIHTPTLLELEKKGQRVIPTARAAWLTMDREGIRRLAAEELRLPTSPYRFCGDEAEYHEAVAAIGYPFVIKPVMSSSGKGQSVVREAGGLRHAWDYAQSGGRAGKGRVIVEGLVAFDYEITMLTVRHVGGVSFCAPIGHRQEDGDYRESWQPQPMSESALAEAQRQAAAITAALGGWGVFGVEFFVRGDEVIFSEVSPRPHDTGLVTLISQEFSEFALHARAILGLPIPVIHQYGPSASCAVLVAGDGSAPRYHGVAEALAEPDTQLRLFGKPTVSGRRRMAVTLARADTLEAAIAKAMRAKEQLRIEL